MGALIFFIVLLLVCFALLLTRLFGGGSDDGYWDGPKPSRQQEKEASRWMTDHLIQYPNSYVLENAYPKEAAKAKATRRYLELETMRKSGAIDEIDYNLELEKILHLIDITDLQEK